MFARDKRKNVVLSDTLASDKDTEMEQNSRSLSPKIAYFLGSFPNLSETFILQEILELEHQGLDLHVFALTEASNHEMVKRARDVRAPIMFLSRLSIPILILAAVRCCFKSPLRFLYTSMVLLVRYRQKSVLKYILYASYLTKSLKQAGITHVHTHFATSPTTVAQAVHLLTGISYSFMAHAFDIYLSSKAALAYKIRTAAFVVTCSNHTKEFLVDLVDEDVAKRIHCYYIGLDSQHLPSNTSIVPLYPPLILSVARLIEKKGISYLLRACKILTDQGYDFTCRIVGDGLLRPILEREIDELGLTGKVEMWGAETNERIIEMYQQATIMTLPCIIGKDGDRDGLPVVLIEALYMGVPVVSTPVSGIPELITPEVNGLLVPPQDSSALAAALARLLDDPSLRHRLAIAGRQTVTKQFDLARNIGSLRDLLCTKA